MDVLPGTFGVVSSPGLIPAAIKLSTRSPFSHAFVVVGGGLVVEAHWRGARIAPIAQYRRTDRQALAFNDEEPLTTQQRKGIVRHSLHLLGTPYNFLDIAGIGMSAWAGWQPAWLRNRAQAEHRLICSQLVARVYFLGAGIDLALGRPDSSVTPGDLGLRITERLWESGPACHAR